MSPRTKALAGSVGAGLAVAASGLALTALVPVSAPDPAFSARVAEWRALAERLAAEGRRRP